MNPRPASLSRVSSTHLVMPNDTNYLGTIFGGKVMQYIDTTAGIAAMRHSRRVCVTASLDRLDFHVPIESGHIIMLHASVNRAFATSMEVGVRVERENPLTGEVAHTASAYLTFVALDETGRPVEVPPLGLETDEDRRRFDGALARREARKR
ncbi:MAG: acyl-CoA thioesterase [Nitrospirota bacterium]|jgi:acyl-CoA hydrolase